MGGATGNAFVNILNAAGVPPVASLVREAIQNSCDAAADPGRNVRVVFRLVTLRDQEKMDFLRALGIIDSEFQQRIGRDRAHIARLGITPDNCLTLPSEPLKLLFIEDYNTCGLYGDPHDPDSHFHKLLLSVGDTSKRNGREKWGGSYGYGKCVFALNSRLRTIAAYSAFERDRDGTTARLMACAYLEPHMFRERHWTGRAWYGTGKGTASQVKVHPLKEGDAHTLAEQLHFQSRRNGSRGTSLLIVDSLVTSVEELRRAVEDWWWPRLVDQALEVKIVDEMAGRTEVPAPRDRGDLLPFIRCYTLAQGRAGDAQPHQQVTRFQRVRGRNLGKCAFEIIPPELEEGFPEGRANRVAMIRSLRMVTEYADMGRPLPVAVGAFVADDEIDEILRLSEPTSHDRWDPGSGRLELWEDPTAAREIVAAVRNRIKEHMRRFQLQARPPEPDRPGRIHFLERQLASFFHVPPAQGPTPGRSGPVEIRFEGKPEALPERDGTRRIRAKVALKLRDDCQDDDLRAKLTVGAYVLEDDENRAGGKIDLTIFEDGHKVGDSEVEVTLTKSEWRRFVVETAPYEASWCARLEVEVEPVEG